MYSRLRNPGRHTSMVDLTFSDDETTQQLPEKQPLPVVPEPERPIRRRKLTARECLLADRIAFGEIDPPPPPPVAIPSDTPSPSHEGIVQLEDDMASSQSLLQPTEVRPATEHREPMSGRDLLARALRVDDDSQDSILGRANRSEVRKRHYIAEESSPPQFTRLRRASSQISNQSAPKGEDSPDNDVAQNDKDALAEPSHAFKEPKYVGKMAHGRPRRACAPTSFQEVTHEDEQMYLRPATSKIPLTEVERAVADKYRAVVMQEAEKAHDALWRNRHLEGFSHKTASILSGIVRSTLVYIGQFFGAVCKVEQEMMWDGFLMEYVLMEGDEHVCPPAQIHIRRIANHFLDLTVKKSFEETKKPGKDALQEKRDPYNLSRKEKKIKRKQARILQERMIKAKQSAERLAEVAEGIRRKEEARKRAPPIQQEPKQGITPQKRARTNDLGPNTTTGKRLTISHMCVPTNELKTIASGGKYLSSPRQCVPAKDPRTTMNMDKRLSIPRKTVPRNDPMTNANVSKPASKSRRSKRSNVARTNANRARTMPVSQRRVPANMSRGHETRAGQLADQRGRSHATRDLDRGQLERRKRGHERLEERLPGRSDVHTSYERNRQRRLEGTKIETGNKGFAMLAKMGWSEGQSLGAKSSGIREPIVAEFRSGRKGLGRK